MHVTPVGLPLKRLENAHCQSNEHAKNADDNHGDVKSLQRTFGLLFFVFLVCLLAGEDFRKCLRQKENKKVTTERSREGGKRKGPRTTSDVWESGYTERSESCLCLGIMKLLSVGTKSRTRLASHADVLRRSSRVPAPCPCDRNAWRTPLRASAWEVRPRSLLRMIAEPEMEAVGTRMYRDKKKPAADLILSWIL